MDDGTLKLTDVPARKGRNSSLRGKSISTICPVQGRIQFSGLNELSYLNESRIAARFDVAETQPGGPIRIIELLSAFAGGPLRSKAWQGSVNLVAIDAIAAFVRATAWGVLDATAGNGLDNNLCKFADAVVFLRAADVEDLVVDHFPISFEHTEHRGGNVANVDDRAPGRAVTLNIDSAGGISAYHEVVQHDIEPQARRRAISGGVPHVGGAETLICQE